MLILFKLLWRAAQHVSLPSLFLLSSHGPGRLRSVVGSNQYSESFNIVIIRKPYLDERFIVASRQPLFA